jgi:hypothetical protein
MQKHGSDINDPSVLAGIEYYKRACELYGHYDIKNIKQILQLGVNVNADDADKGILYFSNWFIGLQDPRRREIAKILLSEGFDLQLLS